MSSVSRSVGRPVTRSVLVGQLNNRASIIKSLFANREQGFAYDPNDLSTLYQDAAGTIPVTSAGQPVGLIKDKSGRNNHAFQTVSASRPILQQTPILGDEVIQDTDFNTASYWTTAPTISVSGGFANFVAATTGSNISCGNVITLGKTYQLTFTILAISSGSIRPSISVGAATTLLGNFNMAGTYTVSAVASGTVASIQLTAIGTTNATIDSISVKEITGYLTDQNYLAFDGVDDFLVTNSINFTTTDKVSLFAGVRKLSDAVQAIIAELSINVTGSNGSFAILAPGVAKLTTFRAYSAGTLTSSNNGATTAAAPNSFVGSAFLQISTDTNIARVDGVTKSSISTDQGTGNYGNYPLYIGSRGGTSIPFNGNLYSLIGVGRLTTDAETLALEKAIAKNTGVTLNV